MENRISQITLEVTPEGRIDRITIEEVDGSITDFKLSDEVENVEVADSLFRFAPPTGVEVVTGSELSN
jgi:outer membrane lipoprotein-sorting protein